VLSGSTLSTIKDCLKALILIQEKKRHQQPPSRRAIV
ncbi:uncharacterized protein METZ01_LOCUS224939, partial [marine metagenome]